MERLLSRCLGRFVSPSVDNGLSVDVVEVGEDSRFKLGLGGDAYLAEHRSGHFGEEAFDQVEPRAVLGGEHEREPARRLGIDPGLGLLRDTTSRAKVTGLSKVTGPLKVTPPAALIVTPPGASIVIRLQARCISALHSRSMLPPALRCNLLAPAS